MSEERQILVRSAHVERFFKKVEKTEGCWLWRASTNSCGYGTFSYMGKIMPSHRVSWLIHNGEIPNGLCVCHKCDNPPCINPDHLFLGTHLENFKDASRKGRLNHKIRRYGEIAPNAKVSDRERTEIIDLCKNSPLTQRQIGKSYGIVQAHVSKLYKNHLKGRERTGAVPKNPEAFKRGER